MKQRCSNPKNKDYSNYGGKGIRVCSRWLHSFENFILDMGKKPTIKHTIERFDNEENYKPSNCGWATPQEQSKNRKARGPNKVQIVPTCHPERKHRAKGLCAACYQRENYG